MAVSKKRRKEIGLLAVGGAFDHLSEEEFDALTDKDHERVYRDFFAAIKDPEELHIFADTFNWDCECGELKKVIQHPLCDLGTALLVYWRGQPGYYLRYATRKEAEPYERAAYSLLREIERRVKRGEYKTARLAYNPRKDHGEDMTPKKSEIKKYGRDVPALMYQRVGA